MQELHQRALRPASVSPKVDDEIDSMLRELYPDLKDAIDYATGTEDPVYEPFVPPRLQSALTVQTAAAHASGLWLPEGYSKKYGLHVVHRSAENAGSFTGGGWKWVHHITVSSWWAVDAMADVLVGKRACPELLLGGRRGLANPVLFQFMPLNAAGRALEHVFGPETNRANAIQLEICANVGDVPSFDEWRLYKAIANVVRFTNDELKHNVPWELARSFHNTERFGPDEFVKVAGHCGHMHVPGNTHIDPTPAFMGRDVMWDLHHMPAGGWPLFKNLRVPK